MAQASLGEIGGARCTQIPSGHFVACRCGIAVGPMIDLVLMSDAQGPRPWPRQLQCRIVVALEPYTSKRRSKARA
eukprot:9229141-Alexandrium_andersonii.AAC.1